MAYASALASQGKGVTEIARILHADSRTVRNYLPDIPIRRAKTTFSKEALHKSTETKRRKFLESDRFKIAETLLAEGNSQAEVMRRTGLSDHSMRKYFPGQGWKQGGSHRGQMVRVENERKRFEESDRFTKMEQMVEDGASLTEIHRTLGVDKRVTRRYFPNAGWTKREGVELRRLNQRMEKEIEKAWGRA